MLTLINTIISALIAIAIGILGAYFANWEQNIYFEYLKYILTIIFISSIILIFIDKKIALILTLILLMGLSWYYSTKLWFNKK